MDNFLLYQGKVAIAVALFYIFYRLLLSQETLHRLNRIVLIGTVVVSFLLPFCVITFYEVITVASFEETVVVSDREPEVAISWLQSVILSIYIVGILAVITKIVVSVLRIKKVIASGRREVLDTNETLVVIDHNIAPFSWMGYIVISSEDCQEGCSQILIHEKAHIALKHSWDVLFVDIISAFQWFNPVIWMLKSDLRAIHEFEADDMVLKSGVNIQEYQYLLLRKALKDSGYSIANSLNHSTLKKRITMMWNKKSSRLSGWKTCYIIPIVGFFLIAMSETKVKFQEMEDIKITIISENGENIINIDGEVCSKEEVSEFVSERLEKLPSSTVVTINGSSDIPMGDIIDIKEELRKTKALKIQYSIVDE